MRKNNPGIVINFRLDNVTLMIIDSGLWIIDKSISIRREIK